MRLDRDSKHPIWLGLVLIFAAFIFTLFFITRVHASEVQTYGYNNVIIISGTGQRISFCFADGSFGLRFSFNPTDEDDGYNIYTHEEFEQRFNDFFAYVLASQTYIVFYDDYVAKGTYEYLEEYFLSKGCGWVLTDAVFPMTFPDSFSLMQGHAGMWFFPYYTRSVPLPPTPTPDPSVTSSFGFIGYFTYSSIYYYVEISGSNIFKSVELDIYNSDVSAAMTEVGTSDPNTIAGKSVYMNNFYSSGSSINWGGPNAYLYFTGDNISVSVWRMSSSLVSDDVDYIKANYSYITLDGSNTNMDGYPWFSLHQVNELNCLVINYDYYRNTGSYNMINKYGNNIDVLESYSAFNRYYNSSVQLQKAYAALLTRSEEPVPTQDPNVSPTPEPLPTSSESIHVILPTGTPTPTPPFSVPAEDPGGGSGSPGGSSQGSLTPGQVNSTLNTFKQYTQNNGAFAFLYACTGLIPDDALYFLFILLFILLLLACLRLFVHFTGG